MGRPSNFAENREALFVGQATAGPHRPRLHFEGCGDTGERAMTIGGPAVEMGLCPVIHWLAQSRRRTMGLREEFNDSLKEAMKARDQRRVSTLRLVLAALKERDIASRTEESRAGISDDEIRLLLAKMIKQREESAETYDKGGRPEPAKAEREEITIIQGYLPKQMNEAEVTAAAKAAIAELGAASMKDMGKVIGSLKERYAGQMDFAKASGIVKG